MIVQPSWVQVAVSAEKASAAVRETRRVPAALYTKAAEPGAASGEDASIVSWTRRPEVPVRARQRGRVDPPPDVGLTPSLHLVQLGSRRLRRYFAFMPPGMATSASVASCETFSSSRAEVSSICRGSVGSPAAFL